MKKILISMMLLMSVASVYAQTENDEMTREINRAIELAEDTMVFNQMMTDQLQILVEQGMITKEKLEPFIKEMGEFLIPLVKERKAALYKEFFTLEEMKQMNAFLASPAGQKMSKMTTQFSSETIHALRTPEAQKKLQEILMRYMLKK